MATPTCFHCSKRRKGRYTRIGKDLVPQFYCYLCVPEGQGRGETAPAAVVAPATSPEQIRAEGQMLITSLPPEVAITSEADYHAADEALSRVGTLRKQWATRMEAIIRPIRQGLDQLYALNRDVDRPLEAREKAIRRLMADFKLEEQRRLQAIADEQARLEREAEERRRQAEQAKTVQMRTALRRKADDLAEQAEEILATPQTVVQAENSAAIPVKVATVSDVLAFCKGIGDGYIPADCIEVKQARLNAYLKDDPEGMAAWPGVTVSDDVQIRRR